MRKRKEIEQDGARKDISMLEVLLDLRGLLTKDVTKEKKRGRPAKLK